MRSKPPPAPHPSPLQEGISLNFYLDLLVHDHIQHAHVYFLIYPLSTTTTDPPCAGGVFSSMTIPLQFSSQGPVVTQVHHS